MPREHHTVFRPDQNPFRPVFAESKEAKRAADLMSKASGQPYYVHSTIGECSGITKVLGKAYFPREFPEHVTKVKQKKVK